MFFAFLFGFFVVIVLIYGFLTWLAFDDDYDDDDDDDDDYFDYAARKRNNDTAVFISTLGICT